MWRPRAEERAVTLAHRLDEMPGEHGLLSDRGKIEQVLVNFISNALKFTPAGGRIDVRLISHGEEDGRYIARLEVSDQGPGIPISERERIFRPFEQTAAGRAAGGAGLGLSICAGHAALLGGTIGVESAPGGGARFWVEFPANFATLEQVTPRPRPRRCPRLTPEPGALADAPPVDPARPAGAGGRGPSRPTGWCCRLCLSRPGWP